MDYATIFILVMFGLCCLFAGRIYESEVTLATIKRRSDNLNKELERMIKFLEKKSDE